MSTPSPQPLDYDLVSPYAPKHAREQTNPAPDSADGDPPLTQKPRPAAIESDHDAKILDEIEVSLRAMISAQHDNRRRSRSSRPRRLRPRRPMANCRRRRRPTSRPSCRKSSRTTCRRGPSTRWTHRAWRRTGSRPSIAITRRCACSRFCNRSRSRWRSIRRAIRHAPSRSRWPKITAPSGLPGAVDGADPVRSSRGRRRARDAETARPLCCCASDSPRAAPPRSPCSRCRMCASASSMPSAGHWPD